MARRKKPITESVYFIRALKLLKKQENLSATFLQRNLKISFVKAAAIVEALEVNKFITDIDWKNLTPRKVIKRKVN